MLSVEQLAGSEADARIIDPRAGLDLPCLERRQAPPVLVEGEPRAVPAFVFGGAPKRRLGVVDLPAQRADAHVEFGRAELGKFRDRVELAFSWR